MAGNRTTSVIKVTLGIAVAILFLWLAVRNADFHSVWAAIQRADYRLLVPFIACLAAFYGLKAVRWATLIGGGYPRPPSSLVGPMMIGFAANNVLPLRAGEVLRVFVAGDRLDIPKTHLLATLVVERFFDLLAVAILFSVGLASQVLSIGVNDQTSTFVMATVAAAALAAGALLLLRRLAGRPRGRISAWLTARGAHRLDRLQTVFREGLGVLRQGKAMRRVVANSLAQWALLTFCIYLSIVALDIRCDLSVAMILLGIIVLGISLPSSPGFIGTIEYAFVLGLGFFGIAPEPALAAAVVYHGVSYVLVTGSGAVFALTNRHRH